MTHRIRRTAVKTPYNPAQPNKVNNTMPSPYRDPSNAAAKKFRTKANPQSRHHPTSTATRLKEPALPSELVLLRILSYSLADTISDPKLQAVLQTIKGHLYEKEFLKVFKEEKYLKAYAVRWVPSRALAFREMFIQSEGIATFLKRSNISLSASQGTSPSVAADKIICLGGGAGSELLAFGCAIDELCRKRGRKQRELHLVDVGPYEALVEALEGGMRCSGERVEVDEDEEEEEEGKTEGGEGATAAEKEKGKGVTFAQDEGAKKMRSGPDITNGLITTFHRMDVFAPPSTSPSSSSSASSGPTTLEELLDQLSPETQLDSALNALTLSAATASSPPTSLLPGQTLLTLLFTITELFLQSRPSTLLLLRRLASSTRPGDLLLIADSANEEASAVAVGQERAFPVTMLVDHILCGAKGKIAKPTNGQDGEGEKQEGDWSLVEREDSKWYRLREGLHDAYPAVKLENMRYWLRLYRRN